MLLTSWQKYVAVFLCHSAFSLSTTNGITPLCRDAVAAIETAPSVGRVAVGGLTNPTNRQHSFGGTDCPAVGSAQPRTSMMVMLLLHTIGGPDDQQQQLCHPFLALLKPATAGVVQSLGLRKAW